MTQQSRLCSVSRCAAGVLTLAAALIAPTSLQAQGCVVAHGSGLPETLDQADRALAGDFSVSYRWFQSDRHFVCTTEQKQRAAAGDQVINRSNFTDLTLNYAASSRVNVEVTVPFVVHDRSQVVKNSSGVILDRFHTQATGLADISVVGNYWVLDPVSHANGNIQIGAGLSLPTGKDNVNDTFETYDKVSGKVVAVQHAVDQSIEPGSGGYGIIVSLYGYHAIAGGFTGYFSGQYTITPQDTNGVLTSNTGTTVMSIPDTYLLRLGVECAVAQVQGLSLSLGFRDEGVAVYDLVGHSNGFRRPGYSMAVEPGIIYTHKRWAARFYIPCAIQRDRLQSVPDKQKTRATGAYAQGDAAFSDYEIISSVSFRF